IGRHFSCFYTRAAVAEGHPAKALASAAATGHFAGIAQQLRLDGSAFWAEVSLQAMNDASGKLLGFTKLVRDITGEYADGEEVQPLVAETGSQQHRIPGADGEPDQQASAGHTELEHTQSLLSAI